MRWGGALMRRPNAGLLASDARPTGSELTVPRNGA